MSLRPPPGSYPVVLGGSFTGQSRIHTVKYDFKPASIDPSSVGELELRSDLSASMLLPQKPSSSAADASCVEFSGSLAKKSDLDSAPTCLLIFDAATRQFRLERVDTAAHMKQLVREVDGAQGTSGERKRKMSTPATMQRRAEVASKRAMHAHSAAGAAAASVAATAAMPASAISTDPSSSAATSLSSSGSICSLCSCTILMSAADAPADSDSDVEDALKEQQRSYLHCDSCFTYSHKQCVLDKTGSSERAARGADKTWSCIECE